MQDPQAPPGPPAGDPQPAARVRPARMLARGLVRHCPSCGSGGLFEKWFKMRANCPRCRYRFEREEGFFLGAYIVNLVIAEGLVILSAVIPAIFISATRPGADLVPLLVGGLVAAVVAPFVFHPFSRTIWVAFDLMLRPADAREPTDRR